MHVELFCIPNRSAFPGDKVYSLIGGFCGSPVNFHAKDGSGYKFLGEVVVQLDKINPQVGLKAVFHVMVW